MPSPNYVQLNISVPKETREILKRLCEEAGVSLSQAIQDYAAKCDSEDRLLTTAYEYPAPIKEDVSGLKEQLLEMQNAISALTKEVTEVKK